MRSPSLKRSIKATLLLALTALSCDSGTTEPDPVAQSVAIADGNGQSATVGQLLATGLAVVVTGSDGEPFEGATVQWQVSAGGGSVAPATSTTDAQGRATAQWTLGQVPGANTLTATAAGLTPVSFTATATAGPPASVTVTPASATIDALQGTTALAASARDAFGNALTGTTFTWESLDATTVTVNAQGVVTGVKVGTAQVRATTGGVNNTATIEVRQVPASVSVTPTTAMIAAGASVQMSATVKDANGHAIANPQLTWSSADMNVATVTASGVVTGVSGGTVNVTATSGSANGAGAVTVVANFSPTANTQLSGTLNVGRFTVPAGVTVTVTNDVVINALDAVTVNGSLIGNCVGISITGGGSASYSGTIDNSCASPTDDAPDIVLVNNGPLTIAGAAFEYDGDLEIRNDPGITASAIGESLPVTALGQLQSGACAVTDLQLKPATAAARSGANGTSSGGAGASAGSVRLLCDGDLTMTGSSVEGRDGGTGGDGTHANPTTDDASGTGGKGGNGGDVTIHASGNITLNSSTIRMTSGGDGGDMTVTGRDPGGSATATGGDGGNGGNARVTAGGSITIGSGGLQIIVGRGGNGGRAVATGGNGLDAGTSAATPGGNAKATGGKGGNSVDGRLQGTGGVFGLANISVTGGDGGAGGEAVATAGEGGDGILAFPNGAAGGSIEARGGAGGVARTKDITGTVTGMSGDGGNARLSGGRGGNGADRCSIPAAGGTGGAGGAGSGQGGAGGTGDNPGDNGTITVAAAAGNGGNGDKPLGAGGAGGAQGGITGARVDEGPNFLNGANAGECAPPPPPPEPISFRVRLSDLPNNFGNVTFGTHTVNILDLVSGAVIGSMSVQTVGQAGNHFFGDNPERVGLSGGDGSNGFDFFFGDATLTQPGTLDLEEMDVCFINTSGVGPSSPITVEQLDAQGTVIDALQVTDPNTNTVTTAAGTLMSSQPDPGCRNVKLKKGGKRVRFRGPPNGVMDMRPPEFRGNRSGN